MTFSLVQFIVLINSVVFVVGIDVRVLGDADFRFSSEDAVSVKDLAKQLDDNRAMRFIGDLTIGERQPSETVFSRTIEVSNPTPEVYRTSISVSVDNEIGNSDVFHSWWWVFQTSFILSDTRNGKFCFS
ncbi:uncharacterized protein LOC135169296 isoform X2 [Diachasmimorpha longicaudata]|uniref:uncharacterized protein LOC135169296 isoform X2 n=1 Tax=Diachasmimorpha longicaudata TaxID=58733 RepID=UPI0030B8768D